ncbi:TetR/AcrR family transcriptional regulator [Pseudonocardiaceae bacterium YIM PH 21723]|nr:TetR/AcrR family transcriptional regulator [Pseudonocardiaceae bacterium YIM PH 21723]
MPRVSQEYLDTRRRQILDAAAVCFARDGFHATSMPDIFTEAGLSAGAVYRYFPSKQAIFDALMGSAMHPVHQALRDAAKLEPPLQIPEIIDLIHREMITSLNTENATSLLVQFWAEAMRAPRIREAQQQGIAELHELLLVLLQRLRPDEEIGPDRAWALIALSQGTFISQTVLRANTLSTESLVNELRLLL